MDRCLNCGHAWHCHFRHENEKGCYFWDEMTSGAEWLRKCQLDCHEFIHYDDPFERMMYLLEHPMRYL